MGISALEYQKRIKKLLNLPLLQKIVAEEIQKKESLIVKEKVKEFKKGEKPDGSIIGIYKSKDYEVFKFNKNPLAGGVVDLILTGNFIKGLDLKQTKPSSFLFDSTDSKKDKLVTKYGSDIMSLNEQTFNTFLKKEVKNNFVKRLKSHAKI